MAVENGRRFMRERILKGLDASRDAASPRHRESVFIGWLLSDAGFTPEEWAMWTHYLRGHQS